MSTIRIRWSRDGGRTWSHWAERSLGEEGDFLPRVEVGRQGQAEHWTYEVVVTDPVRVDLMAASIRMEPGFT